MTLTRKCTPGPNKKSAKLVRGLDGKVHCVRYGDPNMTIKKHLPSRKHSFCRRHKCIKKTDPATPGFQSCVAWGCKMQRRGTRTRSTRRKTPRRTRRSNRNAGSQRKSLKTRAKRRVGSRQRRTKQSAGRARRVRR